MQSAINAAGGQLPKNLPNPPSYRKVNPADSPILLLGATSDTLPLTEVDDNVESKLAQTISQIDGVAQVSIGGQQKPAIRVQLDPAKLVAKGLSMEDVRAALAVQTVNTAKGSINGDKRAYTIYANDQLPNSKDWNDAVITYRNGMALRVSDVGTAITGPQDSRQAAWADGKRGVFLVIFKQPGANVIETVDKIMAALPKLSLAMPPAIKVSVLSDRTQTIRASVHDVQFTLLLTIALVVMVIFIFLRNFWATVIPSVTVPLALLGTCGAMWLVGYSLDNLSLMALTISVGFVVDDAIVMLENITRYIEEGETPMAAAIKGSREIGFTILSISISLVAVLIPLLLMGGIVGRLFREFSVTLAMTIFISAFVSLTLTPMMASRFLKSEHEQKHGRLYQISEKWFDALLNGYARGLDVVLKYRFATFCVFLATLALSVYLFAIIPKGFFPQQDTGLITGQSEAAQDISFADMVRHQQILGDIVRKDPDVAHVAMSIGGSSALNSGRMYITLKPGEERHASADQIIARLQAQLSKVEGAKLFLQASQDLNVGGRSSKTQYQFTLQSSDLNELNTWAPKLLAKMKSLPELRDVATDQQTNGTTLTVTVDRNQAARYGITPDLIDATLYDAFGQRQIAQYFTQISTYEVIIEVLPPLQATSARSRRFFSPLRPLAVRCRFPSSQDGRRITSSRCRSATKASSPAITLSFNLAPGVALGQATTAVAQAEAEIGLPPTINSTFQGNAQAFQASLATVPMLIVAALIVVYLILGMLYESYIHPLTILSTLPSAGVGAIATLMLFGFDFSLIALIGIILLIGIVKKNGIMLVDSRSRPSAICR